MFLFFAQIAATTLIFNELNNNNVLIIGAHPNERARFEPVFTNENIIFWNANYDRDFGTGGKTKEEFEESLPTCHIFADFNDMENLQQVSKAASGRLEKIWFDAGVIGYTRWKKEHWEKILALLAPSGTLFFDMSMPLETNFCCLRFYEDFLENNQRRKQGWSHTTEDLLGLFQVWLPEDGICMEPQKVEGYFTYLCQNPPCTSNCFAQPESSSPPQKTCQHDEHKCEGSCVSSEGVFQDWDNLLKKSQKSFVPTYVDFIQKFLGVRFSVQEHTTGYPFQLSQAQQSRTDFYLIKVTRLM